VAIAKTVRAVKEANPDAIIEVDPVSKTIRILSGASAAAAKSASEQLAAEKDETVESKKAADLDRELADFEARKAVR
jgi:hypothetical protein